jgi:hypothetical protein
MSTTHQCDGALPENSYGAAIEDCSENENGELWVGNGEYESQVNFCPYCGFKAPVQLRKIFVENEWTHKQDPKWVLPETAG